jgi:hypothetical protein
VPLRTFVLIFGMFVKVQCAFRTDPGFLEAEEGDGLVEEVGAGRHELGRAADDRRVSGRVAVWSMGGGTDTVCSDGGTR